MASRIARVRVLCNNSRMLKKPRLFTAGPTPLHPDAMRAASGAVPYHRTPEFAARFERVQAGLMAAFSPLVHTTRFLDGTRRVTSVQAEISANAAIVSDYRFRGISQSNENPAVQAGFDYAFENGFYLGTWGSTVDFDSISDFNGSLELDFYGGWGREVGENSSIDVGYIYYAYPGQPDSPPRGTSGEL